MVVELIRVLRTERGAEGREGGREWAGTRNEVIYCICTARTFATSPPTVPWQTFSHDRAGLL